MLVCEINGTLFDLLSSSPSPSIILLFVYFIGHLDCVKGEIFSE